MAGRQEALAALPAPGCSVTQQQHGDTAKSASKTLTETIIGEHEHTIVGYSLVKGLGDGEPVASERFSVGGHEWVLLFYPDGKRSSADAAPINMPQPAGQAPPPQQQQPPHAPQQQVGALMPMGMPQGGNGGGHLHQANVGQILDMHKGSGAFGECLAADPYQAGNRPMAPPQGGGMPVQQQALQGQAQQQQAQQQVVPHQQQQGLPAPVVGYPQQMQMPQHPQRRDPSNEYSALFVALIGESENPQGVVNTSEGRVVRAFHRFTLVDQSGGGRDLTKGRRRDQQPLQGAVKISCARQDPNARNCHGYRKFVKRAVLENPQNGFLLGDTLVIRYTIELVVTSGGALSVHRSGSGSGPPKLPPIVVPHPTLDKDLAALLESQHDADVKFKVENAEFAAHKLVLTFRSPFFRALLNNPMKEGQDGIVTIQDVREPVFRALLYFVYADALPEELQDGGLDCAMAQHLLVAADRYEMPRLRRICERRLTETIDVDTVATTLTLAEQNHAEELKRVAMEFACKQLAAVMATEGYQHMVTSCPQLQTDLLRTVAVLSERTGGLHRHRGEGQRHEGDRPRHHPRDPAAEDEGRRVRQRTRE